MSLQSLRYDIRILHPCSLFMILRFGGLFSRPRHDLDPSCPSSTKQRGMHLTLRSPDSSQTVVRRRMDIGVLLASCKVGSTHHARSSTRIRVQMRSKGAWRIRQLSISLPGPKFLTNDHDTKDLIWPHKTRVSFARRYYCTFVLVVCT